MDILGRARGTAQHDFPVNERMKKIRLQRDSVCMADDMDAPHENLIEIADKQVNTVAESIIAMNYLPCISGGKATWILRTDPNGAPLAVIAQQWSQPKLLSLAQQTISPDLETGELQVYVEYYCQVEPELVYDALQDGRPLPDRYGR
jgi:hypothetical protein